MSDKKIHPAKLVDLAKILGVSKVTISKALRNHKDISEETKIKVRQLADKLSYKPNLNARNLSARKSNIIGLVIPKIAHFFFGSIIEAMYDTAFENNYETLITVSQEMAEREKEHIESLLAMRVDGLIVSITEKTKDYSIFERVLQMKVPIVFIDRVPNMPDIHSVTVNDRVGAFLAIEYFAKKGYRNIGLIGGHDFINIGKERTLGFIDAMNKYNLTINNNWIVKGGFGEEDGYKGFKELFKYRKKPEAVLAVTYPVALGMYQAANEAGIRVPKDLNITCFGNNVFKYVVPTVFNYVDQPTKDLGAMAVKMLVDLIDHPERVVKKNIELKTRLLLNGINTI